MKAVRVKGFGGVDQLEVVELADPEPQPGQLRIRVEACGLNYADVMQREGLYPGGPKPPFIPGSRSCRQCRNGGSLPVGSRVVAIAGNGCHADRICVYAASCMPIPDVDVVRGGGCVSSSILDGVSRAHNSGQGEAGETVFIHAAAGGVGTAAIQIGKLLGLRVIGTASSEEKTKTGA